MNLLGRASLVFVGYLPVYVLLTHVKCSSYSKEIYESV